MKHFPFEAIAQVVMPLIFIGALYLIAPDFIATCNRAKERASEIVLEKLDFDKLCIESPFKVFTE